MRGRPPRFDALGDLDEKSLLDHARHVLGQPLAEHRPQKLGGRILDAAIPAAKRRKGHPAKRTFQALRIEANEELASLKHALPISLQRLRTGGRFIALSYHSLEDKMVKRTLRAGAQDTAPPDLPVVPADSRPWLRLITRGSEVASDEEVAENPRARSVRLRAAEKVREAS